jgi:hypothetical protein
MPDDPRPEDYLVAPQDATVLSNLAKMGTHLRELQIKMLQAEAVYKDAQREFQEYSENILPAEMLTAGVSRLDLIDGGVMELTRNYSISPNKNAEDQRRMAAWLREHGGESLLKEHATVAPESIEALKEAGIPFVADSSMNSSSVKAFLKSLLGEGKGAQAVLQLEEIPKEFHLFQRNSVTISSDT